MLLEARVHIDLGSKLHSTAPVWVLFGFKLNERGEPIEVNKLVCRLSKTGALKSGNATNLKAHLKHNHDGYRGICFTFQFQCLNVLKN